MYCTVSSGVFCIVVVRYKPCTTKQRRKKMEAKTSSQYIRSQLERDGVQKVLEWADAQQRRCPLIRDSAYRKICFERSAASRCSAVDIKRRQEMSPMCDSVGASAGKKIIGVGHEGEYRL